MGFTKLDDGLAFSSILSQDDSVFKVWVLILSRTERDGVARISAAFIESVTRKSAKEVERCLAVLESPDAKSRSTEHEGRRIERVSGGFFVLNYNKYRQMAIREAESEGRSDRRSKSAHVRTSSGQDPDSSASASASASACASVSVEEKGGLGGNAPLVLTPPPAAARDIHEVFAYWQTVMGKPKAKLTGDRERRVKARLREGYTSDDLKAAVDGCKASAWHQGANDDGRIYDDLELICRDGKHVEQFMAVAANGGGARSSNRAVIEAYRTISEGDL